MSMPAATLPISILMAGIALAGIAHAQPTSYSGRGSQVVGSGWVVTQSRPIDNFSAVESRGGADVVVRVGPTPSLSVTADDNLLPLLITQVRRNGVLVLETNGSYRTRQTPRITITVPRLSALAVQGSGSASIDNVDGPRLALAVSGSGDIQARGRTGDLAISVSGSGDVDASGLASNSAAVVINGSGDALVRTSGTLTGVIGGSGDVRYLGNPRAVTVQVGGSGSVKRAR